MGANPNPNAPITNVGQPRYPSIQWYASRGAFQDGSGTESRSWCLNDKPTLEQLLAVQEHFGLPSPALVEKDWYVVKALAAIAAAGTAPFRSIFGEAPDFQTAMATLQLLAQHLQQG